MAAPQRHPMLPDIRTSKEAGFPSFELVAWFAVYAPAGTPEPIIQKLSSAVENVVTSNAFREKVEAQGAYSSYMAATDFADFTKKELGNWCGVFTATGIELMAR